MKLLSYLFTVLVASIGLVVLTSAGVVPEAVETAPPVEQAASKKAAKKEARKQAKLARLQARYEHATSAKAKSRIQHRINQVNEAQEATTLEILALIFAFVFPIAGLILAIMARKQGGGTIATIAFWVSLIFLILAVVGIILSIALTAAAFGAAGI